MKINQLFEKRIELKNCQINGGRLAATQKTTSTSTCVQGCSDTRYTVKDDNKTTIQVCTDYNCPD
ncbi:hypothetical protein [Pedobacter panaciterrae]|jgi:hypothetical protein|uniref:DUF4762 domain-containing protein n=1 Tax=Pedobacter panaciterrae TaxID=363849 RepID=A0ABU8NMD4_9SPHI|nr:hypothetical protein [Pedobacter panaciterrae]NQX53027.1 hypothetical protein [Pedobacter panaciterrae]